MGILASVKDLDKKFSWSFFGFVLAIFFGLLSVYTAYWKDSIPRLEFEVLSNSLVLDVREKVADLDVFYQSQDIAKSGKTLSVLLVRVVNNGSADILSTYYDPKAPVGLSVQGGRLVRADLTDASSPYLRAAAQISADNTTANFGPVILEKDEWFVIKLLVLHEVSTKPSIISHGKVAGMRRIPVVRAVPVADKEGFWVNAFGGGVWTQLVRLPAYFFGLIALLFLVIAPTSSASELLAKWSRKKTVRKFKEKSRLAISDQDEFIFSVYVEKGLRSIQDITNLVANTSKLQGRVVQYLRRSDGRSPYRQKTVIVSEDGRPILSEPRANVGDLIKSGFIAEVEGKWIPVPDRVKVATNFVEYVELVNG